MTWQIQIKSKSSEEVDEAQKEMSFNFYNCENIKVIIPNKIKSVLLSRCKKVDL